MSKYTDNNLIRFGKKWNDFKKLLTIVDLSEPSYYELQLLNLCKIKINGFLCIILFWGRKLADSSLNPKESKNNCSINTLNLYPENIKIITSDDPEGIVLKENDHSKYKIVKDVDLAYFEFEKGARCVLIKHKTDDIWNYSCKESKGQYPETIVVNQKTKTVTVSFSLFYLLYEYSDNHWIIKLNKDLNSPSVEDLVIVTADDSKGTNVRENDVTKYYLKVNGKEYEYKFKEEALCINVKFNGKIIWDIENEEKKNAPKVIHYDETTKVIFIGFEEKYKVYGRYYDEYKLFLERKASELKDTITIITGEDQKGVDLKENDNTKYSITSSIYATEYELKEGAFCHEIKCKNETVWKYNGDLGEFPSRIIINHFLKSYGKIILQFPSKDVYYKYNYNKWKICFTLDRKSESKSKTQKINRQEESESESTKQESEDKSDNNGKNERLNKGNIDLLLIISGALLVILVFYLLVCIIQRR